MFRSPSKPRSMQLAGRLLLVATSLLLGMSALPSVSNTATSQFQPASTVLDAFGFAGLVSIGDRELFVQCQGSGSPLVMLESGLGGVSGHWSLVQPELARYSRVCAYDRAGMGLSDPPDKGPHNAQDASRDFEALLEAMRVDEPIVLVGFSIGGLLARYYASMHPTDVSMLVLIDATPPVWTAMTLSGYDLRSRHNGLLEFSGLAPDAPEMLDILKAGEEVFTGPAPVMPVYMLTSGIKSTSPGMYGDQRHQVATRLQNDQSRELDAVHEIAELCTHQLPFECPDVVNAFLLRVLDESSRHTPEDVQPLAMTSNEPARPRRKALAGSPGDRQFPRFPVTVAHTLHILYTA